MTVEELIKELEKFDKNLKVIFFETEEEVTLSQEASCGGEIFLYIDAKRD